MIRLVADKDVGNSANDAPGGRVILPGAHHPVSRLFNVDLPTWVVIPEGPSRHGRNRVLLVVDMCDTSWELRIDQVRPCLISYAR